MAGVNVVGVSTDGQPAGAPRFPLAGTTALVTAGGGAIGSAAAIRLARDGADVLLAGRTQATLETAADRVTTAAEAEGSPATVRWSVADALIEDDVAALVARAAEVTGRLDIAVGVVGGSTASASILDIEVAGLEETLRQNVVSAFLVIKYAGRIMADRGGGSIVAVSSMQAVQTAPLLGPYCAAKAGLEMLCRVAADELGHYRVRVNTVRPGLTRTGKTTHPSANPAALAAYMEQQPIDRPGEPEDIAAAIRYLAGPESSWVTGESITVDGGTSLRRFPDMTPFWNPGRPLA
jgi:NAD(P)-dependent dehydrogenase (short-subunit alcohol dehydrogenase family)